MVVVSGSWTKNVATFPALAPDNMVISTSNNNNTPTATPTNMSAKAVLICRPNSHPFQERTLCLDQPVKIGRSVARARATATNAIFDCKVLSRNHALLWYEGGKFYLQVHDLFLKSAPRRRCFFVSSPQRVHIVLYFVNGSITTLLIHRYRHCQFSQFHFPGHQKQ